MKDRRLRHRASRTAKKLHPSEVIATDAAGGEAIEASGDKATETATGGPAAEVIYTATERATAIETAASETALETDGSLPAVLEGHHVVHVPQRSSKKASRKQDVRTIENSSKTFIKSNSNVKRTTGLLEENNNVAIGGRDATAAAADISEAEVSDAGSASESDDTSRSSMSSRSHNSRRSSTTSCGSSSPSSGRDRRVMGGGKKKKRKIVLIGGTSLSSADAASIQEANVSLLHKKQREQRKHQEYQQLQQDEEEKEDKETDEEEATEEKLLRNRVQTRRGAGSLVSRPAAICCGGAVLCVARGEGNSSSSNSRNNSNNNIMSVNCEGAFDVCGFSTRSGKFLYSCRGHSAAVTAILPLPEDITLPHAAAAVSLCLTTSLDGTLRMWWTPAHALQQQQFLHMTEQQQDISLSKDRRELQQPERKQQQPEREQQQRRREQQECVSMGVVGNTSVKMLPLKGGGEPVILKEEREKYTSSNSSSGIVRYCYHRVGSISSNELLTVCLHKPILGAAYAAATREVFLLLQMPAEGERHQRQKRTEEDGVVATNQLSSETTIQTSATSQRMNSRNRKRDSCTTSHLSSGCCYGVCTLQLDELLVCYDKNKQILQQAPSLLLETVLGKDEAMPKNMCIQQTERKKQQTEPEEAQETEEEEETEKEETETQKGEEGAVGFSGRSFCATSSAQKRQRHLSSSPADVTSSATLSTSSSSSFSSFISPHSTSATPSGVWNGGGAVTAEDCCSQNAAAAAVAIRLETAQVIGAAAVAGIQQMQQEAYGQYLFQFTAVPTAFTVSNSGQYTAVVCGKQVLLYNKQQDKLVVLQHDQQLLQIVLHPEDQFMAAGDIRGRIALWFGISSKRFFASGVSPSSRSSSSSGHQQQNHRYIQLEQNEKKTQEEKKKERISSFPILSEQQKKTSAAILSVYDKCVEDTMMEEDDESFPEINKVSPISCYCDAAVVKAIATGAAAAARCSPSTQSSSQAFHSVTSSGSGSYSSVVSARLLDGVDRSAAAAAVTAAATVLTRMCHVVWRKEKKTENVIMPLIMLSKQHQGPGNTHKRQRRNHSGITPSTVLHWHAHAVAALAFSADGLLLLSGGEEGVLVLWQVRHAFQKQFLPRLGAPILHISCVSPSSGRQQQQQDTNADSSRWAAVSCADNSVKLIDTYYLRVGRVIQGLDIPVSNFFFSPKEDISAAAAAVKAAVKAALAAASATTNVKSNDIWTEEEEEERRYALAYPKEDAEADLINISRNEKTNSILSIESVSALTAAAERKTLAFSLAEEILLQRQQEATAGPRSFLYPLSLSPFLYATAATSSSYGSFPSYASSPAAAVAAKQQLLQLHHRGVHTPWFLQGPGDNSYSQAASVQQQQQDRTNGERKKEGTLLLGTQGSRLQVYDSKTDQHLLHLLLRPHRMYTSRVNESFGHTWQTQLAAADCCCSCVAVVEARDCTPAFQGTRALEAAVLRNDGSQTVFRSAGKKSYRKRDLCRLEDELIYHPQHRSFCLSFWVYQQQGKHATTAEDGGHQPFVLRTRVEDCHVNDITALQPHSREPRFFFSLSLDTTFKAWREVVSPSPVPTEAGTTSGNNSTSFFSCILEGSFRCMQPLCCTLSSDASLFVISHGQLLTLWNPLSFDLLHLLPVPTAANVASAATGISAAAATTESSHACSSKNDDRALNRKKDKHSRDGWTRSRTSIGERQNNELMFCNNAEEKCNQLGLLEGTFGMHVVAATATIIFIYDLLSLSVCWMKSFLHDEGSLIDFLFVEPGPGQHFGVVLAAVYPDSSIRKNNSSKGELNGSSGAKLDAIDEVPVHDVRIYAFRSVHKDSTGNAPAATRHPLLPLQPVLGLLDPAEATASHTAESTTGIAEEAAAKETAAHAAEADEEKEEEEEAPVEHVEVACVVQQIRRGAHDAIVAGAFSWPPPSSPVTEAAADKEEGSETSISYSTCYEAHKSTLMLLTAGYHIDVLEVQQETVSVDEGEAAAAAAAKKKKKKKEFTVIDRTRGGAADLMQEKELLVPPTAEGDIEIHMSDSLALQREDVAPPRQQRPLQQMLRLQHLKQQIEKESRIPEDHQRQIPAASSLATLFCRSKSNSSSTTGAIISRGTQQDLLLLPAEAAAASHAGAPPSVLLERFIDAAAERTPAPPVETDGDLLAVDQRSIAAGPEEEDAAAADTAAIKKARGSVTVQRASRSVLGALARRSHGKS